VSAGLAADAGETETRIAAGDEPLDRLLFDRALEAPGGAQFLGVPGDALVKRARTRVTGPVDPARWRSGVSTPHSARNARGKAPKAPSADQEDMANGCKRTAIEKR